LSLEKTAVSITKCQGLDYQSIKEAVYTAIEAIEFQAGASKILLKPNLNSYWDYSTGKTTDPRVVAAIVDYIRQNINVRAQIMVGEADASAMKTKHAFTVLGYRKMAEEKGVELVDLSMGERVKTDVSLKRNKFSLEFSKTILDSDLIINVPKLRYHKGVGVSCCLKNLYGSIATEYKFQWHKYPAFSFQRLFEPSGHVKGSQNLWEVIVAAAKVVKPALNVVDGITAYGSHPIRLKTVVAGTDPVATDSVVAGIMGYGPRAISHIRLAAEEGLGTIDKDKIELRERGTSLRELRSCFPYENFRSQEISWKLQLIGLKLYARVTGDTVPPALD
jgi:uncharacterized protein (DUF362 family)